jgi:hypothetical protein
MNTFVKYCPNLFVASCTEEHSKGETIVLTTKYGKEVENEVHNYLGESRDGKYLYSITRVDGFNSQERAKNKAERLTGAAVNAINRSDKYYQASQEGKDFLSLGEPIKIGHHSERRHRKLIERNWERLGKSISEQEKAEEYKRRSLYWEERANKIDLSLPDSLEYFEFELMKAKEYHNSLKENPELRSHSMSLQYANKKVKDLEEKVYLAVKLWGDEEDLKFLDQEKKEKAEAKTSKSNALNDKIKELGGFFAFNNDQFKEGYQKGKENGTIEEDEKVIHFGKGLYFPSSKKEQALKLLKY